MRIVAGLYKGRKLKRVELRSTRETADIVKESVFNMLGPITGQVLDLFAGSGAYGFEALSRGASSVHFIDHERKAVETIVQNGKLLDVLEIIKVHHKDYLRFIKTLDPTARFDYIFLDPPYEMNIYVDVILKIQPFLSPSAMIVCEAKKEVDFPREINQCFKIKEKQYGIKQITIYQFGA